MSDPFTFWISLGGFVLSIIYILMMPEWGTDHETYCFFPLNENIDVLLKDYEITNDEIARRGHITLLVGTILVAAAFLIVGQTLVESNVILIGGSNAVGKNNETETNLAALASIGLYSIWLFVLHGTSKRLDNMTFARLKAIEVRISQTINYRRGYQFGVHSFIKREFDKSLRKKRFLARIRTEWWIWVRRRFWGWIYLFLCLYWMYVSDYMLDRFIYVVISLVVVIISYIVYRIIRKAYLKYFKPLHQR